MSWMQRDEQRPFIFARHHFRPFHSLFLDIFPTLFSTLHFLFRFTVNRRNSPDSPPPPPSPTNNHRL
ncbi:hypothetical protein AKJ16_DCAP04865 [Drosera capensis]